MTKFFTRIIALTLVLSLIVDPTWAVIPFAASQPSASAHANSLFEQQAIVAEVVSSIHEILKSKPGAQVRRWAFATKGHVDTNGSPITAKRAGDSDLTPDEAAWLEIQLKSWRVAELGDTERQHIRTTLDSFFHDQDPHMQVVHQHFTEALKTGLVRIFTVKPGKNPLARALPRNEEELRKKANSLSAYARVQRNQEDQATSVEIYIPYGRYKRDFSTQAFAQDIVHELAEVLVGVPHWLAVAKYERAYGVMHDRLTYRQRRDIDEAVERQDTAYLQKLLLEHSEPSLEKAVLDLDAYQTGLVNQKDLASAVFYRLQGDSRGRKLYRAWDKQLKEKVDRDIIKAHIISEEAGQVYRLMLAHYFRQMRISSRRFLAFKYSRIELRPDDRATLNEFDYMFEPNKIYFHLLGLIGGDTVHHPAYVGDLSWEEFERETLDSIQLELFGSLEADWRTMPALSQAEEDTFVAAQKTFLSAHYESGGPRGNVDDDDDFDLTIRWLYQAVEYGVLAGLCARLFVQAMATPTGAIGAGLHRYLRDEAISIAKRVIHGVEELHFRAPLVVFAGYSLGQAIQSGQGHLLAPLVTAGIHIVTAVILSSVLFATAHFGDGTWRAGLKNRFWAGISLSYLWLTLRPLQAIEKHRIHNNRLRIKQTGNITSEQAQPVLFARAA
jgi:hypothetical protein